MILDIISDVFNNVYTELLIKIEYINTIYFPINLTSRFISVDMLPLDNCFFEKIRTKEQPCFHIQLSRNIDSNM